MTLLFGDTTRPLFRGEPPAPFRDTIPRLFRDPTPLLFCDTTPWPEIVSLSRKARTAAVSAARRPYFLAVAEKESGFDTEFALMVNRRLMLSDSSIRRRGKGRATGFQFMPSTQGLERELQEVAAMLECTDRQFLPTGIFAKMAVDGGRAALQARLTALKHIVKDL